MESEDGKWWEADINWNFHDVEGQVCLFAHIAFEKGVDPTMVPDAIMKMIKGTCWAEAVGKAGRINDIINKPLKPCNGTLLTAEEIARGDKPCTLRHGVKFGENTSECLDYMEQGAKKAEYAMSKRAEQHSEKAKAQKRWSSTRARNGHGQHYTAGELETTTGRTRERR